MKKIRIAAMIIPIIILLSMISITVSAQAPTEVYTSFIRTSLGHSGDGTAQSPYAYFEDALNAVADGGTIYIVDSAFINYNESAAGIPFVITKNVTITTAPNRSTGAFHSRMSGIVLGADVTFRDVVLEFPNGYRPIICANGYTLTLENAPYSNSTNIVHLAGGGMTGYSNTASGSHSKIIVKGSQSKVGNIYAGSIDGSFDGDVDIQIENVIGANIGAVYACGALEGYYDGDNFMDYNNRPEFPTANAKFFPVNGSVSVGLNNTGLKSVYGTTGGIKGTSVSVSSEFLYSCTLDNISALTVEQGSFKPYSVNNGADITIKDGATLDISDIDTLEANNFYGGGILVMGDNSLLTINGTCSGETEFRTQGGGQNNSYIVQPERMYIKTNSGDGTFTFNPYYTQQGMTFGKKDDGWYTSAAPEIEADVLTGFDLESDILFVPETEINNNGMDINTICEFTENSPFKDLSFIPIDYKIAYKGKYFTAASDLCDDYYEGNFNDLSINFTPVENVITVSRWSYTHGLFDHISSGIYDIEITAPTDKGNVTRALRLVVLKEGETEEDYTKPTATPTAAPTAAPTTAPTAAPIVIPTAAPTTAPTTAPTAAPTVIPTATPSAAPSPDGYIHVTYTNSTGSDIQDAKMIAAAYKDGIMQWVKTSEEDVNIKSGEHQTFEFNISDTDYDTIKLFIWDSILGMKPYDCYTFLDNDTKE